MMLYWGKVVKLLLCYTGESTEIVVVLRENCDKDTMVMISVGKCENITELQNCLGMMERYKTVVDCGKL